MRGLRRRDAPGSSDAAASSGISSWATLMLIAQGLNVAKRAARREMGRVQRHATRKRPTREPALRGRRGSGGSNAEGWGGAVGAGTGQGTGRGGQCVRSGAAAGATGKEAAAPRLQLRRGQS